MLTRKIRARGWKTLAAAGLGLALIPLAAQGTAQAQVTAGDRVAFWGSFAGSTYKTLSPETVTLPADVTQVATSNSTVYALLTTGKVYAWGTGAKGQLGDGQTVNSFTTPVQVKFPHTVTVTSLSVNSGPWDTVYAIDKSGEVWGWGANGASDLCLGQSGVHASPVKLPFAHVTAVAGAADHTTFDAAGVLYSCGMGVYGELGDGSDANATTPVPVTGLSGADVVALTAGFGGAGALLSDGTYWDWGLNGDGQDGNGTTTDSAVPVQVTLPEPATEVFQGGNAPNDGTTLALLSNSTVEGWGSNAAWQLADGNRVDALSPIQLTLPPDTTYQAVASGGLTSYGVSLNGTVYAWGSNKAGAVGNGTTVNAETPVRVDTGATALISATSDVVAVALKS